MPVAEVASVVVTNQGLKDLWTDATQASGGAAGSWKLATVGLYKANIPNPTMNTVLADLQEVLVGDWAEYLQIATTGWGAVETRVDGSIISVATPLLSWTGPAAGGGPTVYGAFILSPLAGTHLLAIMPFTAPVGMTDNTKVLSLDLPQVLSGGPWVV
jgi:hypothetical protein